MNLLQKVVLIFFITHSSPYIYSQEANVQKDLADIQNTVNQGEQTLKLDYIPQFQDYSAKIPKQIKDILAKAELKDLQVDYDSSAGVGAISATTDIAGTPAIVRILVGKSISSATTFQEKFKQNLQGYQDKLKAYPQKGIDIAKKGLNYISTSSQTPEEKQNLINEALKKKDETKTEPEKPVDATEKQSWVSKQLAGYQGGILFILPKGFTFESILSDLKFLDYINFEEIIFGLGSGFTDPVYDSIPQGFSLVAKVNSNIEPFNSITSFFNKLAGPVKMDVSQPFSLRGGMLPGIGGSSFGFALPGQISFALGKKPIIETDQLNISVILLPTPEGTMGVSGVSTGLSGGLKVLLSSIDLGTKKKLNDLDFQAAFAIDSSAEANITGVMQGLLNLDQIGLPLEFGNITLTVGVNPENVETLGLAEVGMAGELDFGPTDYQTSIASAIDVKLSGQNTNILVYGDLEPKGRKKEEALSLKDIANLTVAAFNDLHIHIDEFANKLPDLGLKKATFYFSPRNTIFANKLWKSGAKVDIQLDIFGSLASLECDIGSTGFEATGFMSAVNLGPLTITGAGGTKKCFLNDSCLQSCDSVPTGQTIEIIDPHAAKDATGAFELTSKNVPTALKDWTDYSKLQGPIVNIRFKPPTNIGMFISAEIDLNAGKLGSLKADACLDVSLKGVTAHFEAQAFNILDTVFTLNAPDFIKPKDWYICAKLKQDGLTLLQNEIEKLVDAAKKEVTEQLDAAKSQVESAKKAYTKAFQQAQSGIDAAKDEVNTLKKKLDAAKDECSGDSHGSEKKYPYQRPHQFNDKYAPPLYAFIGNLTLVGSETYTTTINNTKITLAPNSVTPLIKDVVKPSNQKIYASGNYGNILQEQIGLSDFMKDRNNPFIIDKSRTLSFELTPTNGKLSPIKVLMNNSQDVITIYVWRDQPKLTGYKIIFNTQSFAEYVTQSYFYDHLSKGSVSGFAFGLTINGDNIDITDPTNTTPSINRMFNINILVPTAMIGLNLLDISLFPKIGEKNLKTPMSYTDLFFGPQKTVQILPLTTNDFKALKGQ